MKTGKVLITSGMAILGYAWLYVPFSHWLNGGALTPAQYELGALAAGVAIFIVTEAIEP